MVNSGEAHGLAAGRCMMGLAYRSTHPTASTVRLAKDSQPRMSAKSRAAADDMGRGPRPTLPTSSSRKGHRCRQLRMGSLASFAVMRAVGTVGVIASFSPQSRVQRRQVKVFGAIVLPYCALYRNNCSTFDSFNARWVRRSAEIIASRSTDALVYD